MLTPSQFHEKLLEQRIPVKYVEALPDGVFKVWVEYTMTRDRFRTMLEDIEAMPEVRSAGRPRAAGGPGIVHVVPSWLPP